MVAWRKENELRICYDRFNVEGKKESKMTIFLLGQEYRRL